MIAYLHNHCMTIRRSHLYDYHRSRECRSRECRFVFLFMRKGMLGMLEVLTPQQHKLEIGSARCLRFFILSLTNLGTLLQDAHNSMMYVYGSDTKNRIIMQYALLHTSPIPGNLQVCARRAIYVQHQSPPLNEYYVFNIINSVERHTGCNTSYHIF